MLVVPGPCDPFIVTAKTNQRATFNWSAAFDNPLPATPAQTADLQLLNEKLANVSSVRRRVWIGARHIKVGITYNITVCAREEFSDQEVCGTVSIERVGETVPKIRFPTSKIRISPSIRVKFRGESSFLSILFF